MEKIIKIIKLLININIKYKYNNILEDLIKIFAIIIIILLLMASSKIVLINDFNKIIDLELLNNYSKLKEFDAFYKMNKNNFQHNHHINNENMYSEIPSIHKFKFNNEFRVGYYSILDFYDSRIEFLKEQSEYCRKVLNVLRSTEEYIENDLVVNILIEKCAIYDVRIGCQIFENIIIDNNIYIDLFNKEKDEVLLNLPDENFYINVKRTKHQVDLTLAKKDLIYFRGLLTNREGVLDGLDLYRVLSPYKKTDFEKLYVQDWTANIILDEIKFINEIKSLHKFINDIEESHVIKLKNYNYILEDAKSHFTGYSDKDEMPYGLYILNKYREINKLLIEKINSQKNKN